MHRSGRLQRPHKSGERCVSVRVSGRCCCWSAAWVAVRPAPAACLQLLSSKENQEHAFCMYLCITWFVSSLGNKNLYLHEKNVRCTASILHLWIQRRALEYWAIASPVHFCLIFFILSPVCARERNTNAYFEPLKITILLTHTSVPPGFCHIATINRSKSKSVSQELLQNPTTFLQLFPKSPTFLSLFPNFATFSALKGLFLIHLLHMP